MAAFLVYTARSSVLRLNDKGFERPRSKPATQ